MIVFVLISGYLHGTICKSLILKVSIRKHVEALLTCALALMYALGQGSEPPVARMVMMAKVGWAAANIKLIVLILHDNLALP